MSAAALVAGVCVCLGAGVGSILRALVMDGVASRGLVGGTAWVNVPASFVAGLAAQLAAGLGPVPAAGAPGVGFVLVAAVLGTCGGLSTYSTLALDAGQALLDARHGDLVVPGVGVLLGLTAAVGGLGCAVLLRALL